MVALEDHNDLWMILGPGEPDPTADEQAAAVIAYRAERAKDREAEAKRAAEAAPAILAALERLARPVDISTLALLARKGEGLTYHSLKLLRSQGRVSRHVNGYGDKWTALPEPTGPAS